MRFLYITNSRIPTEKAHGIQIMKMCEAFADNGVDVTLVVPKRMSPATISVSSGSTDPFGYYGVKKNFAIKTVPSVDLINVIPIIGYWIQTFSFLFFLFFRFAFSSRSKAIIFTREYLIAWLFNFLGFFVVYECHRIISRKALFFRLLKSVPIIVTNSIGVATEFEEKRFDRVIACPNGVDLTDFNIPQTKDELRKALDLPGDKKIVMYTGHLYKWKGVDTIVGLAESFVDDHGIVFVVVGGTDRDVLHYRNLTLSKNLSNLVFLGHQNIKKIPSYIKAADILLLPNSPITEESIKYTSPIKLAEYMVSLNPIVASDLPSIRATLNESNAILVSPDQIGEFSGAIKKLTGDSILGSTISRQAFEDVQSNTWDNRALRIIDFIRSTKNYDH